MSGNEVDFFIHGYYKVNFFGNDVFITTTHVCMAFVMLLLLVFAIFANRAIRKADPDGVPGAFLNFIELLVEMVDNLVLSTMGAKHGHKYLNYIGALFAFILCCNLSGLLGQRPPTADWGVTLPLALVTFFLIQYNGIRYQKMGKLKGLFEPIFLFFPVNLISEFATPMSLSLRLFGNIVSGTVMMGLIYGLLPRFILPIWPGFLHIYLDVFSGALQAFVFCMLTMTFTANAIGDEG